MARGQKTGFQRRRKRDEKKRYHDAPVSSLSHRKEGGEKMPSVFPSPGGGIPQAPLFLKKKKIKKGAKNSARFYIKKRMAEGFWK